MPANAIEVDGLTKRFGDLLAVDAITFRVPKGEVTGFLGPNGSGKTTTLGMLSGLIPMDAGTVRIAGHDVRLDPIAALANVGAAVEEPAFYPYLSGRHNLHVVARLVGVPRERADDHLARVGLMQAADQRYRGYSQGMRHRLALAAALLPEPDVLLLDEPTNGLDPAGQLDVRRLLQSLAAAGRTVLVSSHLLHEVQETCTHAIILRKGRVLAQGPMSELLSRTSGQLAFEVDDVARALEVLQARGYSGNTVNGRLMVNAPAEQASAVNRALVEAGVGVSGLSREDTGLEARFLEMTEENA
ncbi:MAG: ABC transporter ATP-binding protein [Candidatus Thermoplasmatota archaeon]